MGLSTNEHLKGTESEGNFKLNGSTSTCQYSRKLAKVLCGRTLKTLVPNSLIVGSQR